MEAKRAKATEEKVKEDDSTKAKEETTPIVDAAVEGPKSVLDLMKKMEVPREKIKPPPFLENSNFLGGDAPASTTDAPDDEEEDNNIDEPLTDDDAANMEYLDYSGENKMTATFLIMTLDRLVGFTAGVISKEPATDFRKFNNKADISPDYLDVSSALVKKYQARLSLEIILFITVAAIYAPTFSLAYSKRVINVAKAEKAAKNG